MLRTLGAISLVRPLILRRKYSSHARPSRAKNFVYGGVMLGAASLFGGVMYILVKDMLFQNGAYAVIDNAVGKIETNPQIVQMLGGLPISVHGYTSNRSRRRPAIHESFTAEGARCLDTSFFVQGQLATGKVSLQVVEDEDGKWQERYFAVEIPGHPPQILVQPPPIQLQRPGGWHPFGRFA